MPESLHLRRERLEWSAVDEEIVALDIDTERYLGINPSGRLLWQALGPGATRDELAALLVEHYRIETADAQRDVERFVAELDGRGLLERRDAGASS
jgi:hypothetical protein